MAENNDKILPDKRLEEIVDLLTNHDVDVDNKWKRHSAAYDLGGIQDKRAVRALIKGMEDYESDVRWACIKALGETGEFALDLVLQEGLTHNNSFVSGGAATALGFIGGRRAFNALIQTLEHKSAWVRWNAASALGTLGDIRAIKPLEELLKKEGREDVIKYTEEALDKLKQK
ncbi:MAG: HEAT repeat domain-containing protein [Promethearchaeota archaeon]|nr:MAG: HEAT repeat domain-containing protein [Candidatus Lokiarchaeota archaeon]